MTAKTFGDDKLGAAGDTVYGALTAIHEGLSEGESHALNARLVLLMANEIGDGERVTALFEAARRYSDG